MPRAARALPGPGGRRNGTWILTGVFAVVTTGYVVGYLTIEKHPAVKPTAARSAVPLVDARCTDLADPGTVRPATIQIACGDGNAVATHLVWATWGNDSANGVGTFSQNTCTPDCAGGTFVAYPARFTLSETVPVGRSDYFTRVTITFLGKSPTGRAVVVVKDCYDTPPDRQFPRCPADLQAAG